jgi:hypothetical protein
MIACGVTESPNKPTMRTSQTTLAAHCHHRARGPQCQGGGGGAGLNSGLTRRSAKS